MNLSTIINEFDSLVDNMTPQQIKKMDNINSEDNALYRIPLGLELHLPDELLGNQSFDISQELNPKSESQEIEYNSESLDKKRTKSFNPRGSWGLAA